MRVLPKDDKVIVEGVNIAKKHQKARGHQAGGHHREGHADRRVQRRRRQPAASRAASASASEADGTKVRIASETGEVLS